MLTFKLRATPSPTFLMTGFYDVCFLQHKLWCFLKSLENETTASLRINLQLCFIRSTIILSREGSDWQQETETALSYPPQTLNWYCLNVEPHLCSFLKFSNSQLSCGQVVGSCQNAGYGGIKCGVKHRRRDEVIKTENNIKKADKSFKSAQKLQFWSSNGGYFRIQRSKKHNRPFSALTSFFFFFFFSRK